MVSGHLHLLTHKNSSQVQTPSILLVFVLTEGGHTNVSHFNWFEQSTSAVIFSLRLSAGVIVIALFKLNISVFIVVQLSNWYETSL